MPEGANRPLAGIVVLDLGQVYQGPYATLLMAKAGADVIKIEPPQGEPLRRRAPPGTSTTFPIAMLSSNNRAITLNLKDDRGRALLLRMVERSDVLLENFAPGVHGPARRWLGGAAPDQPASRLRLGLGLRS
jgi:crotonobetainyl-CoA:carnitine CoA-transferase CaiB-like acyl-CoA transferase